MAKAVAPKKKAPKVKADPAVVTQLVCAHIAAHGRAPKPEDLTGYVHLAADIETAAAGEEAEEDPEEE